jgi:coenzyme PQQ synthesis protein D (PqqD)
VARTGGQVWVRAANPDLTISQLDEERAMKTFPKARKEEIVVRELAEEILIYDKKRQRAHCLNATAAAIWKHCDGDTAVSEISRKLAADERVVWYALAQFKEDHLLEDLEVPAGMLNTGLNRRAAMRALGLTAVVALPVVSSMLAPTSAQAATCLPPGQPCTTGAQCCNGVCAGTPLTCA